MRFRLLCICLLSAAFVALATPAFANNDVVQFGSNIRVEPGDTVHDAVCFFCSVEDRGTVGGDIVVFFGGVHIDGHANHDVVSFFGNVRAENNAVIGHDLVSMFGGIHLGDNVTVGQDMVAMFGGIHQSSSASVHGSRVIQPAWIFWGPLCLIFLVVWFIVHEVRESHRRRMYPPPGYPMPPPR